MNKEITIRVTQDDALVCDLGKVKVAYAEGGFRVIRDDGEVLLKEHRGRIDIWEFIDEVRAVAKLMNV